jgi:hypothetical protein
MYDIWKSSVNGHPLARADTTAADLEPQPDNPWLFTDPEARSIYARQGRLDQLKHDILTFVMYEGRWSSDELQLKHEIRRLLWADVLQPKGTFSHLSPHPTVYRARSDGLLEIAGHRFHFGVGQDVVFEPWLARVHYPGLLGPVWIGRLRSVTDVCLCCNAFPKVGELCEVALAILRQTLPNGANGSRLRHR